MKKENMKMTKIEIRQDILDRIHIVEGEKITENIGIVYDFFTSQMDICFTDKINMRHSSYGIKRKIERITGFYVSNLDMKYCLELLGVKKYYDDPKGEFYYYPISEKWYHDIERLADIKEEDRRIEEEILNGEREYTSYKYVNDSVRWLNWNEPYQCLRCCEDRVYSY